MPHGAAATIIDVLACISVKPNISNNKIHGWGIADDLAGVSMMYHSLDVIKKTGIKLKGDLILASTPSKNHTRGIASVLYRGYSADAAL